MKRLILQLMGLQFSRMLQLVFDEQPRSTVRTNAPVEMVRALNNQGLKVDILFDEATHLSQSMKFSKAEKLLKTLLLLKPNDVDGLILLIKVLDIFLF